MEGPTHRQDSFVSLMFDVRRRRSLLEGVLFLTLDGDEGVFSKETKESPQRSLVLDVRQRRRSLLDGDSFVSLMFDVRRRRSLALDVRC